MSTNNKVFQVLVTKGDKALAVAGTKVDALEDGQLGIFDASTNLAVDTPVKEFYLAVGVDTDGDGTIDNIVTSAGQVIQSANVRDITSQEYTAPTPMEFEITDYDTVLPDTDYSVKLEFRNAQIYTRQGYNQFAKTFSVRTSCVEADATPAKLTDLLVEAFEADESGMFEVEAIGTTGVKITANPLKINNFSDVNTMYYNPRQTVIIPSLVDGFNCTGKVEVTVEGVVEQGSGYDIKQKEYHAGGWNGKPGPYRASTAVGLAMPGFEYLADSSAKYDQIHLVYDQFSTAGWGEYLNNLMTTIAVPTGGTVTLAALTAALEAMLPGFLPAE